MRKRNRFLGNGPLPHQRAQKYRPDFRRYEIEKHTWIAHHPAATADEYLQAMRDIAERCGI
jgi:hypothetical protein